MLSVKTAQTYILVWDWIV